MNERQRMQYLESMGVDSFMPRWILPGALASQACVLPEGSALVATAELPREPENLPSQQSEKNLGALVDSLLRDVPEQRRSAASEPTESTKNEVAADVAGKTAARADPESGAAAFSLAFWRVHPRVLVVDSRQAKILPTEALLKALLAANGITAGLPPAEVQTWPLPGVKDRSWSAASETLQMFLESRLDSQPADFLLLMGGEAARVLIPGSPDVASEEIAERRIPLAGYGCEALLAPSLAELLMEPRKKQRLWRLLTPIRHLANEQ